MFIKCLSPTLLSHHYCVDVDVPVWFLYMCILGVYMWACS